jgi:hypothetical protein
MCLTRTADMRDKFLENVYEMVCESRMMMYGVEIWGRGGEVEDGSKQTDKIHGRMCKNVWEFRDLLQIEWLNWSWVETVGGCKVMITLVKYWKRIMEM